MQMVKCWNVTLVKQVLLIGCRHWPSQLPSNVLYTLYTARAAYTQKYCRLSSRLELFMRLRVFERRLCRLHDRVSKDISSVLNRGLLGDVYATFLFALKSLV